MTTPPLRHVDLGALKAPSTDPDAAIYAAESKAASLLAAFRTFAALVVANDPRGREMAEVVARGEAAFPDVPEAARRSWFPAFIAHAAADTLGDAESYTVAEFDGLAVTVQRVGKRTPYDTLVAFSRVIELGNDAGESVRRTASIAAIRALIECGADESAYEGVRRAVIELDDTVELLATVRAELADARAEVERLRAEAASRATATLAALLPDP